MPLSKCKSFLIGLLSAYLSLSTSASDSEGSCQENDGDLASWETPPPPKSCRLFLASRSQSRSSNDASSRKLGIFTAAEFPRGMPLTPRGGDVVLHLIDVDPYLEDRGGEETDGNSKSQLGKWLSHGFLQDAISSGHGGNYEGMGKILTVLPGVGMLASSPRESNGRPNVWASVPETDEANLPRGISPLAGSFALHYNLTYVVSRPEGIEKGGEVLVDRDGWHRRKALGSNSTTSSPQEESSPVQNHLMNNHQLFEEGICIDNLHYSLSKHGHETIEHGYGRGGFASRFLPKGSIVAPVPVLPIPRNELRYLRSKEWKKVEAYRRKLKKEGSQNSMEVDESFPPNIEWREQLLLNYCLGHQNSSVLLFPYGIVNQINHAPSPGSKNAEEYGPVANVGLRWSEMLMQEKGDVDLRTLTPSQLWKMPSPEGLVLEMVALRDISPDEEVLLDYGSIWEEAWSAHVKRWSEDPQNGQGANAMEDDYSPAYIMEDVVSNLRTAEEQLSYPYPDNVFTACFYRYESGEDESNKTQQSSSTKKQTEAIPWKMSAGLFDMMNLRPCKVISREPVVNRYAPQQEQQQQQPGQGKMFYTAIIQNRPGLPQKERIPKGEKHIVSGIPREAFRFVDRPYTSDVHLDAFRHNIGVEEAGLFPEIWLDLA